MHAQIILKLTTAACWDYCFLFDKNMQLCVVLFIFFLTNSSSIVLDMMSTLMKLTAAQRPDQTFLRLVSEASQQLWIVASSTASPLFFSPLETCEEALPHAPTLTIHLRRLLSMAPLHESHQNCL